ncbi:magnesium transporter [Rhodohalobacter sulfatireducens]|jgi:magnesium transporter|uniref:Magnesium transporter MgtE n=1 Tax=Rhodohalobacter sulfatireducens TaxID=2911366 RepID=A0ABS9KF80_9BACT|nr:magnesium transporter [Rhodohalobacter sulfatireducens]MCG2589497.1 magnesium transporter [Rhodohalobacter sulfatireducens]
MIAHLLKPELDELIEKKEWVTIKEVLDDVPAVDVAELLDDLNPEVAVVIFRLLKKSKAADVFTYLSSTKGVELLETFSRQQLSDVMNNLEPDERVALMEELPGDLTQRVLNSMAPEDIAQVRRLLGYPPESVGRLMTTNYVRIKKDWTVNRSFEHIRKHGRDAETVNVIYVVDEDEILIDDLRLNQLILAEPDGKISDIMDNTFEALSAFDDQEEAVRMLSKYDRVALPVVDSGGILAGIVTVDDVLDVAEEETTEDMQLMAGMSALDTHYSQTGVTEMVRKRLGWLVLLFLGQMFTVTAMASYEETLAAATVLALFIPMIISSGGNSGSQAATLIIRALSTDDIKFDQWKQVLKRELMSGLMLGLMLGVMGTIVISTWMLVRGEPFTSAVWLQALTVGTSLVGVVLFGNLSGSILPFIMTKLGLDPAVTSAPFISTLVDVTGIIIYFTVAVLLLRGVVL